jgi:hypothetical protein
MKDETINLNVGDATPRFFVDERIGCIAIRDREHPDFDKDHQGLDADLPDVVAFEMGKQVKFDKFISWDLDPKIIKSFKNRCDILNRNYAPKQMTKETKKELKIFKNWLNKNHKGIYLKISDYSLKKYIEHRETMHIKSIKE